MSMSQAQPLEQPRQKGPVQQAPLSLQSLEPAAGSTSLQLTPERTQRTAPSQKWFKLHVPPNAVSTFEKHLTEDAEDAENSSSSSESKQDQSPQNRPAKRRRGPNALPLQEETASESESDQALQVQAWSAERTGRPPKRTRGRPKSSLNAKVAQEFSALMKELSTLAITHVVVEEEVSQDGSSLTALELHQRATALRIQGMALEHENLARNTKEAYLTYLKFFKEFCDKTYMTEQDARYEVNEEKVLLFFKDFMFKRRIPKVFRANETKDVRVALALVAPESKAKRRPVDLRQVLESIPAAEDGSKVLQVFCESATMDQALKAIVHLQTRQSNRITDPNKAEHLRKSKAIKETLSKYNNDLVIGELVNHRNWSASCGIRNTYTIDEHIRCLLDAWQQPVSETSSSMRLHLSLAIRHAMLLRDEDLRGLNYSDIFMDPSINRIGGTQNLVFLMANFHKGKNNQGGKMLYGVSCRHTDVRRCSVGALGFYFYDLFHVKHETLPDFDDPSWLDVKLIHTWPNVHDEVSYEIQGENMRKCFQRQRVTCRHITHSGRHSGSSEARMMLIARDEIRKAGRWQQNTTKLDQYYDDDPSYHFAVQLAGFLGGEVPFHLKRNEISPSLDLQQQIFPFIETACGPPGSPAYNEWQEECIQEMEERNANEASQLQNVVPLQYDSSIRGMVSANTRQSEMAKKCFLKALLRLRRVILQDAAEYLCKHSNVKSPLLAFGVFETPAFQAFKEQVATVLSTKEAVLPTDMHPNVKMVLQDQQRLIARQGEIMTRLPGSFEIMKREIQGLRWAAAERLDQAMLYLDAIVDYGIHIFKETSSRIESKLDYLIRQLGHNTSGFAGNFWQQPYLAPSWQPALGFTPSLPVRPPINVQSEQPIPASPRRLAQAPPVLAIGLPRWSQAAQHQPQSQPQCPPVPFKSTPAVQTQPTVTTTTTATATTTTTTATTTTTSVTTGGVTVNYRLGSVAAIWEEYQGFEQERQKAGKRSLGISRKHQKQLNNKRRIIEEVEYLASQNRAKDGGRSQEDALQDAMMELEALFKKHSWTVNQLINYCRDQKAARGEKES
ncbi:hypothetical protein EMPS_04069 [Entomortierella parvispora]|uniref:Ndc10 domain-containing protein n=1 Tax=Entomortierella parvispora TaxID=205924 RepID=A0A9P3H7Z7_9FUNG|nr:hypothetical protein EMPS_04069 [Entomortierella parvispora]